MTDTDPLARIADAAEHLAATLDKAVDAAVTIGAELGAIRQILDRPADTITVRPTATAVPAAATLQYASPPVEPAERTHSLLPNLGGAR